MLTYASFEMNIAFERLTSRSFTLRDLIERKTLTEAQADILTRCVQNGDNLLISGATSSGKTTLANVLASFIPDNDRILILEDVAELLYKEAPRYFRRSPA